MGLSAYPLFPPSHQSPRYPSDNPLSKRSSYVKSPKDNAKPADEVRSIVLQQKVMPLLRHDGHLASHVSGLGGTFSEAYDGRSYLPDDAEPDPNHLIQPPPDARSGDHPLLTSLKPHLLKVHDQRYHRSIAPLPQSLVNAASEIIDDESDGVLAEPPEGVAQDVAQE